MQGRFSVIAKPQCPIFSSLTNIVQKWRLARPHKKSPARRFTHRTGDSLLFYIGSSVIFCLPAPQGAINPVMFSVLLCVCRMVEHIFQQRGVRQIDGIAVRPDGTPPLQGR